MFSNQKIKVSKKVYEIHLQTASDTKLFLDNCFQLICYETFIENFILIYKPASVHIRNKSQGNNEKQINLHLLLSTEPIRDPYMLPL